MFENIGRYAEKLAASAGHSRRGFLGRLSKTALGLAGVVGGVLLLPGQAGAGVCSGSCHYQCPDGTLHSTNCGSTCRCDLSIQHGGMTCSLYRSTCGYRYWTDTDA
jgi:hypothetical protein